MEPPCCWCKGETERRRNAVTDAAGEFAIANLPPGEYRIEAEVEGHQKQVRRFTLPLNHEVRVEMALLPGRRTESVEVSAAIEPLRAQSSALGGLIDNRAITGLPLDGREFFDLGLLLAGVTPPAQGSAGSVRGAFAVNVNGAREDSNNFQLDGVFNGDPKLNGPAVTPPVDAVREFEVASGAFDASFGRNSGSQFNVALKSGGNRIHGTAYEFFRNRVTDARNFFAPRGGRRARSISATSSERRWVDRWSAIAPSFSATTRGGGSARASRKSPTCRPRWNASATSPRAACWRSIR